MNDECIRLGVHRLKWLKRFKFDIEDAKTQLLYFEERMANHGITDTAGKYWVLREFWPNNDMSAYLRCTKPNNRKFLSWCRYHIEKDGRLPRVLLQKKPTYISRCDLITKSASGCWNKKIERFYRSFFTCI